MAEIPPWPWVVALALGFEAVLGYPAALNRLVGHPVAWPAAMIEALEQRWNKPAHGDRRRRLLGVALILLLMAASILIGAALQTLLGDSLLGLTILALIATVGLAQRSLYQHVAAVLEPLRTGDLPAARAAVAMIVGRDTANLDAEQIAAAALESLAESFNDGVVAPVFWLLLGGLPGLLTYKSINTADSLIGHKEARWRMFGWAAARTDDLMNLAPARLAGGLIALAGGPSIARSLRIMLRDAPRHASPNAGWPEAATAGVLDVQLGGVAVYDGVPTDRPTFGDGARPTAEHLERGLRLYRRACVLLWLIPLSIGLIIALAR